MIAGLYSGSSGAYKFAYTAPSVNYISPAVENPVLIDPVTGLVTRTTTVVTLYGAPGNALAGEGARGSNANP